MSLFTSWWFNKINTGIAIMSDILVMSKKNYDGKYVSAQGTLTATGTLCSITPASGKTYYHGGSHVGQRDAGGVVTTELQFNGAIKEVYKTNTVTSNDKGIMKGDSMVGDGIKIIRLEITTNTGPVQVAGNFFGFLEDTGTDPLDGF